jgi:hypothetical protein
MRKLFKNSMNIFRTPRASSTLKNLILRRETWWRSCSNKEGIHASFVWASPALKSLSIGVGEVEELGGFRARPSRKRKEEGTEERAGCGSTGGSYLIIIIMYHPELTKSYCSRSVLQNEIN